MIHATTLFRLALLPAAIAALVAGCAPYEPSEPYGTVHGGASASVGLTPFDRLDTNRDGFLSRAEIEPLGVQPAVPAAPEAASAAFHRLDLNADGFLSRAEAQATLATVPGATFDTADANRDGFLSLAEAMPHLRWLERRAPGPLAFEALDLDRDGFLSRTEAEALVRSAQWIDGRWVLAAPAGNFDRWDLNRDGFLSRAEASSVAGPMVFDRYDDNRDGFLSRAEADIMFRAGVGVTGGSYGGAVYGPRY